MKEKINDITNQEKNTDAGDLEQVTIPVELEVEITNFYNDNLEKRLKIINDDVWRSEEKINTINKIETEKKFYISVLNSVRQALLENPDKKIVVLFDLDETLVYNDWKNDNTLITIFRPSSVPLLNSIKQKGASCGFLTSRSELQEQLDNTLKKFEPYINKSYLFSSRNNSSHFEETEVQEKLPENLRYSFMSGDFEKMIFLNKLIEQKENSDKIFIPVDDFQYPLLYKYGVALKDNEKFYI